MEKISVDLCSEEGSGIVYLLASLDCLCGMKVGSNYASSFPFSTSSSSENNLLHAAALVKQLNSHLQTEEVKP